MSRRPLENRQQPARGGDGRRYRWSESPIPRLSFRRVRSMKPALVPLFWWKFDDASGNLTEANGGPALVPTGTGTYQQTALAPGSAYAYSFYSGGSYDEPESGNTSVGLDPGSDIVIDVWFSGVFEDSTTSTITLLALIEAALTGSLRIKADNNADLLLFTGGTGGTTTLCSVARASVPDPVHIEWTVNPTAGTSSVKLNGTTADSDTGLTIAWTGANFYVQCGPGDYTASSIDELKIFGTAG